MQLPGCHVVARHSRTDSLRAGPQGETAGLDWSGVLSVYAVCTFAMRPERVVGGYASKGDRCTLQSVLSGIRVTVLSAGRAARGSPSPSHPLPRSLFLVRRLTRYQRH